MQVNKWHCQLGFSLHCINGDFRSDLVLQILFQLLKVLLVLATISEAPWAAEGSLQCNQLRSTTFRPHRVTITEFGAVGDGVTLNTNAFRNAIFYLHSFADKGGAQLFVPAGRWLTGSFSLISHLTLLLDEGAVILGSKVSLLRHIFYWY